VYCKQRNRRDQAVVVNCETNPRSFTVRNQHGLIRRNRRHLFRAPSTANFNDINQCAEK